MPNTDENKIIESQGDSIAQDNNISQKVEDVQSPALHNNINTQEGFKKLDNKLQEQFSSVAMTADRRKVIALAFVVAMGSMIYFMFFRTSESPLPEKREENNKKIEEHKEKIIKDSVSLPKVSNNESMNTVKPAQLPEAITVPEPMPPSAPPIPVPSTPPTPIILEKQPKIPPPTINGINANTLPMQNNNVSINNPFDSGDEKRKKMLEAKRQAGIMVMGSGKGGASLNNANQDNKGNSDGSIKKSPSSDFLGFGNGALDKESIGRSSAPQVIATKVANLDRTILQGSVINSILETAINTDIPGTLRAIVSRDVYSEAGSNILIPKGSRVIGSYESAVKAGQTRVNIIWNRVIRPDGVDIAIDSAGTDALGRAGVAGQLDNKLALQLMNAFMISYVIPLAAQKITGGGDGQITTSQGDGSGGSGSIITTGTAKDMLLQKATEDFSKSVSDSMKNSISLKPTITIDQGTIVNILVQKDLVFPQGVYSNGGIIIK